MWLKKLLFGERKEEAWLKVLEILNFINVDITKMKSEIDMINIKLRVPGLKKKVLELEEAPEEKKEELPDDGFDRIRQLRKDLNMKLPL